MEKAHGVEHNVMFSVCKYVVCTNSHLSIAYVLQVQPEMFEMFLWTYTLNAKFRDQSRGPTGLHSEMSPGLEITVRACYMLCISLALHILPGTNI